MQGNRDQVYSYQNSYTFSSRKIEASLKSAKAKAASTNLKHVQGKLRQLQTMMVPGMTSQATTSTQSSSIHSNTQDLTQQRLSCAKGKRSILAPEAIEVCANLSVTQTTKAKQFRENYP